MATRKKATRKTAKKSAKKSATRKVAKKKATKKAPGKSAKKISKKRSKNSARKTAPRNVPKEADGLLLEIGTEELPSSALRRLGESLGNGLRDQLGEADLLGPNSTMQWFAAPRRLAVLVSDVRGRQPDQNSERRGPAVQAAFDDDGQPTRAAQGFAQSCGVSVDALERLTTDKGEWLAYRSVTRGEAAKVLIPQCVENAITRLPIPKRMRWGEGDAEFARPVHWIVLLHGATVVPATVLSIKSGRRTRGHRFHCKRDIGITHADRYAIELKRKGLVVADFAERRETIRAQVEKLATSVKGKAVVTDALLDEVTSLVELPHAIIGGIEQEYMALPQEVLVSSMQDHQKYFPVTTARGKLMPHFITVSNIKLSTPKRVRAGNERVLRSRLSDARFFWETDRKIKLADRIDSLDGVLFHKALGSTRQKAERIGALAKSLATLCDADAETAERAGRLAKVDLVTDMVGEFADLQGTIGQYYATHSGESNEVAVAIGDHYKPRFAGDTLPATITGKLVALADKVDSITGIFAAGEEPTGDRDPYGLRRAALGVLRMLSEGGLDLDIGECVRLAREAYSSQNHKNLALDDAAHDRVVGYMLDRLRAHYNSAGYSTDEINAVRAAGSTRPLDFEQRLKAVSAFRKLDAAASLAAANKRIQNIVRKSEDSDEGNDVNELLFDADEERALHRAASGTARRIAPMVDNGDYTGALNELASLRDPVDAFFDKVMVMAEDPELRRNRLALLRSVGDQFLRIADISLLQD